MAGTPSNDLNISQAGYVTFDGTSTFNGRTFQQGTGITITNASGVAGNTTIAVAGGGGSAPVEHLTADSGGLLNPTLNNFNILGQTAGSTTVLDTIGSGSTISIEDRSWLTPFVVDSSSTVGLRGTFQTIASALTAASSGQTIFIRAGTYTENLTLKAGVNLCSFDCDALTPNVTIIGNSTATFTGTASLSGLRLQTNSAAALTVSGSNATIINLKNCYLNCSNNTGITYSSSNASSAINITDSICDTGTTGISYFSDSSTGTLTIYNCSFFNTGGSSTQCTKSAGDLRILYSLFRLPLAYSSSGAVALINFSNITTATTNSTFLTTSGTGTVTVNQSAISCGSASCISVGVNTTVRSNICTINTSNTNVITGAGTIQYSGLSFPGTSSNINTTSQTIMNEGPSRTIGSSNSGATNTSTITNTSNTSSSQALQQVIVGGGTAGDAFTTYTVTGVTDWSQGIDNSVTGDPYVLSASNALGTTNIMSATTAGEINYPLQPAFLAFLETSVLNVTGDGTQYTIIYDTEVFDQGSDFNLGTSTFTAPVTGKYQINFAITLIGGTSMTTIVGKGISSNRTYRITLPLNAGVTTAASAVASVLADMDAADTLTITILATDSGGKIDDVAGTTGGELRNWVSGQLSV